jgi:hypothetical protein
VTTTSPSTLINRRGGRGLTCLAVTVGAAALTAWSAIIHLHLWAQGYRHVAGIGPLFLVQGLAGLVVAGTALALRRPVVALAAAVFLAATAVGLVLSATIGLLGFHDRLDAPYAGLSLVVECAGAALFVLAATLESNSRESDGAAPSGT